MADIFDKYKISGPETPDADNAATVDQQTTPTDIFDKYSIKNVKGNYTADFAKDKANMRPNFEAAGAGVKQGATDVAITLGNVASGITDKVGSLNPEEDARAKVDLQKLKDERDKNVATYGDNPNFNIGRTVSQVGVTAPLLPVKGLGAVETAMRAVPTITAVGTKIAAPLVNRLGAAVATGGIGGAEYGALTSGANEEGILPNAGHGLIMGAIGAPIAMTAGGAVNWATQKGLNTWSNIRVNNIVNKTGMSAEAVKNIIKRLDDLGITPVQAQAELTRMGPKATLADLDESLGLHTAAIAQTGLKPSAILLNRYKNRADEATNEANTIVNKQLGPHIDLETEKANITEAAQKAVGPDYKAAHASNQVLDAQPVIDDIDKSLQTAVGSKKSALAEAKGYLYRTFKKPNGDEETIPRFNIEDLHETRIGLDGLLSKLKKEGNSQESATYRAVNDVRGQVDALVKQNPEMKAADEKFAGEMKKKDALQAGYDVLKKNLTKEQFDNEFTNQPPEIQDAMRKGMRGFIGDRLQQGAKGEAVEAQRLFSKKAANRANLETAFGQQGTGALDALEKEEAFRNTERAVRTGSRTALNRAIQEEYTNKAPKEGSLAWEVAKGLGLDYAFSGGLPMASIGLGAKKIGANISVKSAENKLAAKIEGSADILSRSGQDAQNALSVISRTKMVQDRISASTPKFQLPTLKLPAYFGAISGPATFETAKAVKRVGNKLTDVLGITEPNK